MIEVLRDKKVIFLMWDTHLNIPLPVIGGLQINFTN